MAVIHVAPERKLKPVKPMHGGGQPPLGGVGLTEYFHYLTEAGIPFARLHDVGGAFGGGRFVDVSNVFRDFDADETDPAGYDFTFTDLLIRALVEAGVEPYYRLGTTIENQALVKAYRTHPPKDPAKWARICEHIIRHYTEGWADGFHYRIRYWEIWNEPEVQNRMMWSGTPEEYYHLYDVAAKHLKSCFPHLRIGGYASCGFAAAVPVAGIQPTAHEQSLLDFFYGFFRYIGEHGTPIDFFSWHSYADTARVAKMDAWLHTELERLGYAGLETHLNEWNPFANEYGTAHHSAEMTAMMIAMQHGHADVCCIYDMRTNTAPYCPLFDIRTHRPIHGYYALAAFDRLYRLGTQVETFCDTEGLYALAASDGAHHALLVANLSGSPQTLEAVGVQPMGARYYVLDQERLLSWAPHAKRLENNAVALIEW